jgi:hypothetical protein
MDLILDLIGNVPLARWLVSPAGAASFAVLLGLVMSGHAGRMVLSVEGAIMRSRLRRRPARRGRGAREGAA